MQIESQLTQFINQSQLSVPVEFIEKFVRNYNNRDQWMRSDKVYEGWFDKHFTKYQNFTRAIEDLIIDVEYKNLGTLQGVDGTPMNQGGNKKILEVSFDGLKQIEMCKDKETKLYYIELEKCVHAFTNYQLNQMTNQLAIKDKEIAQLQEEIKGVIYGLFTDKLHYVGQAKDENKRFAQHIKEINDLVEDLTKKSKLHYLMLAADVARGHKLTMQVLEKDVPHSKLTERENHWKQAYEQDLYCKPAKVKKEKEIKIKEKEIKIKEIKIKEIKPLKEFKAIPPEIERLETTYKCRVCNAILTGQFNAHFKTKKHLDCITIGNQ